MAQGRSTKTISMIKWIRTSGLSMKKCLSPAVSGVVQGPPSTRRAESAAETRHLPPEQAGSGRRGYSPCWRDLSFFGSLRSPQRALPTETNVENGTSRSKSGISVTVDSSAVSGVLQGPARTSGAESAAETKRETRISI